MSFDANEFFLYNVGLTELKHFSENSPNYKMYWILVSQNNFLDPVMKENMKLSFDKMCIYIKCKKDWNKKLSNIGNYSTIKSSKALFVLLDYVH